MSLRCWSLSAFLAAWFLAGLLVRAQPAPGPVPAPAIAATPAPERILRVGVTERPPYMMKNDAGAWSGVSIDLWENVAKNLKIQFVYVEAPWSDMRNKLKAREIDIMPILAQGSEFLATEKFTQPYMFSHASASIASTSVLSSLQNITNQLNHSGMFTIMLFMFVLVFVISLVLAQVEAGHFEGSPLQRFASAFWFTVMNMISVGYGETERLSLFSRIVTFLWMVLGLIFLSFFTGSVVSALTTANIESSVAQVSDLTRYRCGVFSGTKVERSLTASGIPTQKFSSHDEGFKALGKGQITAFCADAITATYLINNNYPGQFKLSVIPSISIVYAIGMRTDEPLYDSINEEVIKIVYAPDWLARTQRFTGPLDF